MSIPAPVAFSGVGGTITIGTNTNISVREWKFKISSDKYNTTGTGDNNFKTSITGPLEGTGSFKVQIDNTADIVQAIMPGSTQTACTFKFGSSAHTITGTLNILDAEVTNPAEESVTVDYTFCTTGSFTIST